MRGDQRGIDGRGSVARGRARARIGAPARLRTRARIRTRAWAVVMAAGMVLGGCAPDEPVTRPEAIPLESPFRYPVSLWDARVQGETVVMVHVTEIGAVDSVYVLQPSGEAAFDSAAVSGAYELRFAPGRRGDRRIAMWARIPVRFRISDPGAGGQ